MAKKESKSTSILKTSRGQKFVFGVFLILTALVLLLSFISYYVSGANDQSQVAQAADRTERLALIKSNQLPAIPYRH